MAFTAPRTWTDGELVTKAIMDPHVRDNFLAMPPHLVVRKTADESVTSNITAQDDDQLLFAVAANDVWLFRFVLMVTAATAGDIRIGWTFPSGTFSAIAWSANGAAGIANAWGSSTSPITATSIDTNYTPPIPAIISIEGVHLNGGTAGNVVMQWAQAVSNATATIVKANSTLWAVKLA